MPAVGGSAGSYGPLIVTPDMVPPNAADWDAQEQVYRSGATTWDGIHQQIVRDNAVRRDAADSRGFDTAHEAGAMLAEEAKTISEWCDGVATKCGGIARCAAGNDHSTRAARSRCRRGDQRSETAGGAGGPRWDLSHASSHSDRLGRRSSDGTAHIVQSQRRKHPRPRPSHQIRRYPHRPTSPAGRQHVTGYHPRGESPRRDPTRRRRSKTRQPQVLRLIRQVIPRPNQELGPGAFRRGR